MADTIPPPAGSAPAAAAGEAKAPVVMTGTARPMAESKIYASSIGRSTVFSLLFLVLLPFLASIPAMLYMRISHGLWHDTWGLVLFGIAFALVMFLLLVEMLFSIRARIEIGDKSVRMTLPTGGGPTPLLRYATHDVPYSDIKSVETRREIYGGALAPVLMRGARIITKDDRAIRLGYINEANVDPAFPYHAIAEEIAGRAGLSVADRGNVRRTVARKALGIVSDPLSTTIDEREISAINRQHNRVLVALVAGLIMLVGLGIVSDVIDEGIRSTSIPVAEPSNAKTPPRK